MQLESFGYNTYFREAFSLEAAPEEFPARVAFGSHETYRLLTEWGEIPASIAGRLRYRTFEPGLFPVTGDWVTARKTGDKAVITSILPRKTAFCRLETGDSGRKQAVSANIDFAVIVGGLDADYNPRRIERTLVLAWDSGATPLILLNKADLCETYESKVLETEDRCPGAEVLAVSAVSGFGLDRLKEKLRPGLTAALLGSSGAGKSSLINALAGEEIRKTSEVRQHDNRGKHTTTARELIVLPGGAMLIDNPGMRELQLTLEGDGLEKGFSDIESLAASCRFRDCTHTHETGCAVLAAVESGNLNADHLWSYQKLAKEAAYEKRKTDPLLAMKEKAKWKNIHKEIKRLQQREE